MKLCAAKQPTLFIKCQFLLGFGSELKQHLSSCNDKITYSRIFKLLDFLLLPNEIVLYRFAAVHDYALTGAEGVCNG